MASVLLHSHSRLNKLLVVHVNFLYISIYLETAEPFGFDFVPDPLQKDEINRKAFEKFKKEHNTVPPTIDNAVPSERFDGESILMEEGFNVPGLPGTASVLK